MSDLTYKVLNTDGTITVYDKAAEIDSQLTDIKNFIDTPVATYTHTTNKEVVVSAVDVDTDTFTSVAHGLIDGQIVYPITNIDAGNIYPLAVYAGGLNYIGVAGYYVVNKTDNAFKLSLTSGGAAINLVTRATMDLTKWHFEVAPGNIVISNLGNLSKCIIKAKGRILKDTSSGYILPTVLPVGDPDWVGNVFAIYSSNPMNVTGDISYDAVIFLDGTSFFTAKIYSNTIKSATESTVAGSIIERIYKSPKFINTLIDSLTLTVCFIANGFKVEVYKA